MRRKNGAVIGLYAAAVLLFVPAFLPRSTGGLENSLAKLLFCLLGPAAVGAAGWLCVRRYPERKRRVVRGSLWTLFAVYLAFLGGLLFLDGAYGRGTGWLLGFRSANWRPFETIGFYLRRLPEGIAVVNLAGNLAAFAPMGFFLPLLFRKMDRCGWFLLAVGVTVALVELTQGATGLGACDVDDFILNVAGTAAAYGLCRLPPVKRLFLRMGLREDL